MIKKKILVVEDEKAIRRLCQRLLARMGYKAVFAAGFQEAVRHIENLPALDMVITDMVLPDGDGIKVIQRLREKHPGARVLIITGSPSQETWTGQLAGMGFSERDILFKPFQIDEFESSVRRCLGV